MNKNDDFNESEFAHFFVAMYFFHAYESFFPSFFIWSKIQLAAIYFSNVPPIAWNFKYFHAIARNRSFRKSRRDDFIPGRAYTYLS